MPRTQLLVRASILLAFFGTSLGVGGCRESCPPGKALQNGVCVAPQSPAAEMTESDGGIAPGASNGATGEPKTLSANQTGTNPQTSSTSNAQQQAPSSGVMQMPAPSNQSNPPAGTAGSSSAATNNTTPASNIDAGANQSDTPQRTTPATSADAGIPHASMPNASMPIDAGPTCTPMPEECDGQDNDCDTRVDEDVEPMKCGIDRGICKSGALQCRNGQWDTECQGAVEKQTETCDAQNLDEDCDGIPNNGCDCTDGMTMECGTGPYTCKKGTMTCTNGAWSTCQGEVKGSAEKCDGEDNDCDGTRDNGGDRLCGNGQHCSGGGGCVECTTSSECKGTTCAPATCSAGTCRSNNAAAGAPCSENGTVCDGRGKCVACNDDSDCTGQLSVDECKAPVCEVNRCIAKSQAGKTCSGGGTCTASGTCMAPQRTLFSLCSSGSDSTCPTAMNGFCHQGGFCSHTCTVDADCGGSPGFCAGSICYAECSPSGQCPNGMRCNTGFKPKKSDGSEPNGTCAK